MVFSKIKPQLRSKKIVLQFFCSFRFKWWNFFSATRVLMARCAYTRTSPSAMEFRACDVEGRHFKHFLNSNQTSGAPARRQRETWGEKVLRMVNKESRNFWTNMLFFNRFVDLVTNIKQKNAISYRNKKFGWFLNNKSNFLIFTSKFEISSWFWIMTFVEVEKMDFWT